MGIRLKVLPDQLLKSTLKSRTRKLHRQLLFVLLSKNWLPVVPFSKPDNASNLTKLREWNSVNQHQNQRKRRRRNLKRKRKKLRKRPRKKPRKRPRKKQRKRPRKSPPRKRLRKSPPRKRKK